MGILRLNEFWGCFYETDLIGVIATRNTNHIAMLFIDRKYNKQGVATKLFKTIKEECKIKGYEKITVNSSPYALEYYHHLGFIDLAEEKNMHGIKFIPMECFLEVEREYNEFKK